MLRQLIYIEFQLKLNLRLKFKFKRLFSNMVEEKEPFNGFIKHPRSEESVLNNFDFTVIEEMDPAKCK